MVNIRSVVAVDVNGTAAEFLIAVALACHGVTRQRAARDLSDAVGGGTVALVGSDSRLDEDAAAGATCLVIGNSAARHGEDGLVVVGKSVSATHRDATAAVERLIAGDGAAREVHGGATPHADATARASSARAHEAVAALNSGVARDLATRHRDLCVVDTADAAAVDSRVARNGAALDIDVAVGSENAAAALGKAAVRLVRKADDVVAQDCTLADGERAPIVHGIAAAATHRNERATTAVALSRDARGSVLAASVEHDVFQCEVALIGNAHEIAVVEAVAHDHLATEVPSLSGAVNLKSARDPDDIGVELIHKLLGTLEGLDRLILSARICIVTSFTVDPYAIPRLQFIRIRYLWEYSKGSCYYQK